jgi:VanZ family protein
MGGVGRHWARGALRFGPPVVWMVIISGFSTDSFSTDQTSRLILPFLHWLLPSATPETLALLHGGIRKAAHLTEYGILALLWYRALRRIGTGWQTRAGLIALTIAAAFGGLDELHQAWVPSRTASIVDVGWDSMGAALALTMVSVLQWRRKKSRTLRSAGTLSQ